MAGLRSRIHWRLTLDKASWWNAIARLRPVCRKWHANIWTRLDGLARLARLARVGISLVGLLRKLLRILLLRKLLLQILLLRKLLWSGVACISVRTSRPGPKMDTNGRKQQYSLNPHDRNLIHVGQPVLRLTNHCIFVYQVRLRTAGPTPVDRRRFLNWTSTAIFNRLKNR